MLPALLTNQSELPEGSVIESIVPHGASYWTRTAEISTQLSDGTPASYFLKVSQGDNGRNMTVGEFASMSALYRVMPKFVPVPVGCGSYTSDRDIHFFICELVNMTDEVPEIQAFCKLLAQLHYKGISPNGKYGFAVPTYKGTIPQYTQWHDTWEESFHHSMKWFVYAEEISQGPDEEMRELCRGIFEKVIPRLLRPLETGGRTLQPRLIHGDIWAGNCSTNIETNRPIIYDGACLYAHNESMFLILRWNNDVPGAKRS